MVKYYAPPFHGASHPKNISTRRFALSFYCGRVPFPDCCLTMEYFRFVTYFKFLVFGEF